jgi:predicted nucleic acid-binding protein
MVILDTNIIIDHLRQPPSRSKLVAFSKSHPRQSLAISLISIQELYQGKSTLEESQENILLATVSSLKILPYTYEVSELAGKLHRDSKTPIEFADAAIAATAILNDAKLVTLNKKHFNNIPELKLI